MTKLSDTQLTRLSAAVQRSDGNFLPLPGSLRCGAAAKVVGALLARGLVREEVTDGQAQADAALNTLRRNLEDGRGAMLLVTAAGFEALGIEPLVANAAEAPPRPGAGRTDSPAPAESLSAAPAEGPSASHTAPLRGKAREGTKQAALVAMVKRQEGATMLTLSRRPAGSRTPCVVPWPSHSQKRLGLTITSEKVEGRGRVYRIIGSSLARWASPTSAAAKPISPP